MCFFDSDWWVEISSFFGFVLAPGVTRAYRVDSIIRCCSGVIKEETLWLFELKYDEHRVPRRWIIGGVGIEV